jgi:hypothetical protein
VPCPLPRRIERVLVSIASPLMQPSPNGRRVGIRIVTFEACSGFTHVTARRIAQPPTATFVTRLRPFRLPGRAARQLPDQSTILWVASSSTGDSRLQGALPTPDVARAVIRRGAASLGSWRAKRKSLHLPSRCRPRLGRSLKDELSPIIDRPLRNTVQAQHAGRAASTTPHDRAAAAPAFQGGVGVRVTPRRSKRRLREILTGLAKDIARD